LLGAVALVVAGLFAGLLWMAAALGKRTDEELEEWRREHSARVRQFAEMSEEEEGLLPPPM
jgi:hypothetical protein